MTSEVNQQMLAVTSIDPCNSTFLHNQSSTTTMDRIRQQQNDMVPSESTLLHALPVVRVQSTISPWVRSVYFNYLFIFSLKESNGKKQEESIV
jgi:hypothetical protein